MDDIIAALFGQTPMTPERVSSQYARQMSAWERQGLVAQQNARPQDRGILNAQQANMYLAALDANADWMQRLEVRRQQTAPAYAMTLVEIQRATKPRRAITTHNLPRMTRHYRWTA